MSVYQFIETNNQYIENIDGCLTDIANITLYRNRKFEFYYFEDGMMVNPRA